MGLSNYRALVTRAAILVEQNWNKVPGGTARATNDLISSLLEHTSEIDLVGVTGQHRKDPVLDLPAGLSVVEIPRPGRVLTEGWSRARRFPLDKWVEADIVHAPAYVLPTTDKPVIATIHDLAFVRHPEWFTPNGVAFFRRFLDRVVNEQLSVIVPSQTTADDCVARGISERRLHVVPWGVDVDPATESEVDAARRKYRLPDTFVLFVGTLEPRKNLQTLAAAMEQHPDLPLLVAGPTGWGDVEVPGARMLGGIPDGEVEALMAAATVLAYPSHFEGFGLPVLEAMAQGTPVVTSRGTAPAEILGDAGLAVDTHSAKAIADAIGAIVESEADRAKMGDEGRERAASYRWEATAQQTAALYEMLS